MAGSRKGLNLIGDEVMKTAEAAEYLRITRQTLVKYIREGRIRCVKAGRGWRFLRSELDRYLRGEDARNCNQGG